MNMPIYEYVCTNDTCNHKFEEMQKISDPDIDTCPKCSKKQVKKIMSSTSFQLKGTGWYKTDFK